MGKWPEDQIGGVQSGLGITDGDPELKGVMSRIQPRFPFQLLTPPCPERPLLGLLLGWSPTGPIHISRGSYKRQGIQGNRLMY